MTMGCPYHYDVEDTKSSKSPVAAGLLLGALAVGSIAFSLLNKKKPVTTSDHIVEVEEQPGEFKNKLFLMPHFTVKNFVMTHEDGQVTARVDYKIDEALYQYLKESGQAYTLRFQLPDAYRPLFEGNGVEEVAGESSEDKSYSARFVFHKKADADISAINTTSERYVLDVIDQQKDVVHHIDNVHGAASVIRF